MPGRTPSGWIGRRTTRGTVLLFERVTYEMMKFGPTQAGKYAEGGGEHEQAEKSGLGR